MMTSNLAERGSAASTGLPATWIVTCDLEGGFTGPPTSYVESAESERCSAFFDGQLYDREILARELGLAPGTSGAELVLSAYLRWGLDALNRLNGVYAWALWDDEKRRLLCARDALGVHPLFYARTGSRILVSPSLDSLVHAESVDSTLSRSALVDHICGRWPDPGETYYLNIRRIPPGHALEATNRTTKVDRYWFPIPKDAPVRWVEADELERFDDLMGQAIGRALDLGRAGIFLSGGLDSVSVAAVAADLSRRRGMADPLALSLIFPGGAGEEDVQRGVADQLGLRQVALPFEETVGGAVLESALGVVDTWPSPFTNAWHSAYRALTLEGKNEGVQVIVTGGGGDEWLTVTPLLAADLLRRGDLAGLYRLWRTMTRSFPVKPARTAWNLLWMYGAKPIVAEVGARRAPGLLARHRQRTKLQLTPPWVAPDRELHDEMLRRAYDSSLPSPSHGYYLREGQLSLDHALVSMEMEDFFETSRRTGVPIRMPFWDRDLVDFLYRTPPEALNEAGRSKGLVRGMLQRRFPELGFERQKKVLATNYFSDLVRRDGPGIAQSLGGFSALADLGIVDDVQLRLFGEKVFAAKTTPRDEARLWTVMTLERWVRSRLDTQGR
jgi:asparagine synthase (glutamine-hydrolysing)